MRWLRSALLISIFCITAPAFSLEGELPVRLITHDGESIEVATLDLKDDGRYTLSMNKPLFGEHFLSMRPFKCIEGRAQTLCHLPYPYPLAGKVEPDDWRDLEYQLMFLFKARGEYGINFTNGYIFKISEQDGGLRGLLHEADMNDLASPPPKGVIYPFEEYDLYESEGAWIKELRIGG